MCSVPPGQNRIVQSRGSSHSEYVATLPDGRGAVAWGRMAGEEFVVRTPIVLILHSLLSVCSGC